MASGEIRSRMYRIMAERIVGMPHTVASRASRSANRDWDARQPEADYDSAWTLIKTNTSPAA
jgi:hypothetical protein